MPSMIDIRSREIIGLRKAFQDLQEKLTEIDTAARANDRVLLILHKIALLLIEKKNGKWISEAEELLQRGLKLSACHIATLDSDKLKTAAASLPKDGKTSSEPLDIKLSSPRGREYFHLPLRKNKKNIGILVLCSGRKGFFPDDASRDFVLRLAQLLAEAL